MDAESATPGEVLRARREELGLSLAELSKTTRIGRAYLQALEEDDPEAFPAEAYRLGFLRTYAAALGLRGDQLPGGPVSQRGVQAKLPPLPVAEASGSSPGRVLLAVVVSVLLVVAAVAFAAHFRGEYEIVASPPPADSVRLPQASEEDGDPPAEISEAKEPKNATADEVTPAKSESAGVADPASALSPPPRDAASAERSQSFAARDEVVANVIRLRTLGPNRLEIILDSRPAQRYELKAESELSWRLRRSALLRVDDPDAIELWLDDERLDMGGRSQILLEARPDAQERRS